MNNNKPKKKSKETSKRHLETNENGNTTNQNLWNAEKAALKRSLWVFLELQREVWGYSRVTTGNSGSLSCCPREVKKKEREKFMAINVYMKKKERSQRNNLNLHLKLLVKEEQTKPRISRKRK